MGEHVAKVIQVGQSDARLPLTPVLESAARLINEDIDATHASEPTLYAEARHTLAMRASDKIQALEEESLVDPLTGLMNEKGFMMELERVKANIDRRGGAFTLLMIDLDNFKLINDRFGHEAGNIILKQVAQLLQDCMRSGDIVSRLHGDEFAVLAVTEKTQEFSKRLQALIDIAIRDIKANTPMALLSVSMGSVLYRFQPDNFDTAKDLLSHADAAMYNAKLLGKEPGMVKNVPWMPGMEGPPEHVPQRA